MSIIVIGPLASSPHRHSSSNSRRPSPAAVLAVHWARNAWQWKVPARSIFGGTPVSTTYCAAGSPDRFAMRSYRLLWVSGAHVTIGPAPRQRCWRDLQTHECVERAEASDRYVDAIRTAICRGRLRPGDLKFRCRPSYGLISLSTASAQGGSRRRRSKSVITRVSELLLKDPLPAGRFNASGTGAAAASGALYPSRSSDCATVRSEIVPRRCTRGRVRSPDFTMLHTTSRVASSISEEA